MTSNTASDAEVQALCDEVWKWRLHESPEFASFCGFHQYDDRWDDISEEAYIKREACVLEFLRKAEAIDVTNCSEDVALSHALLIDDLRLYQQGTKFKSYLMPISKLEGIHVEFERVISYMKFDTEEDFAKYLSRLEKLPQRVEQVITVLQKGVEEGVVQFRTSVSSVPEQLNMILNTALDQLGIMKSFSAGHTQVPKDKLQRLQVQARDLISSAIFPSLRKLKTYIEENQVLEFVKDLCYNRIRPKISQLFKDLPDIPMLIEPAPEYMKNGPAGVYMNGTPDGSREGKFCLNCYRLEDRIVSQFPVFCMHEGEPGHHIQGIYALAATHVPHFRRYLEDTKYYLAPCRFSFNMALLEGWALYAEALGEELELYENNFELLHRYGFEIYRAARLVVDTGLHAFGWTRETAIQYMVDHTLSPEGEMINEVERYITLPGQACAYKVGEIKIWELRRKAEAKLGKHFDIQEFHHRLLSCGFVPLKVLEMVVDKYINDVTAAEGTGQ